MGRSSSLVASGIYAPDETPYIAGLAAGTAVLVVLGTVLSVRASRRQETPRGRAALGASLIALAVPALAIRAWWPVKARGFTCGSALSAYLRRDLPNPSFHEIPTALCNHAGAVGLLEGGGIAIVLAIVGTILTFRLKRR